MDIEIKDILVKLLEGQTRLETDVNSIKTDVNNLKADVNSIKTDVNNLKADVNSIKTDVNNLKADVNSIKTDVNNLKADVNGIKTDVNNLKADVNGIKTDVDNLKTDVNSIKTDVNNLKTDVNKNSVKLEAIERKLDIIAEVQISHKEQDERSFREIELKLEEKTSLIEAATKSISKDVKEVIESVEVLKEMTGRHEVDINILKRRPV